MERRSIGSFIAALRKANGLTQRELAEKLGVSDKAVSRWERDETAPDLYLIPVIAEIFGVTSDELLRGERITDVAYQTENQKEKSDKRIKAVLKNARSKFSTQSLICALIAIVGFLAVLLCNSAFYRCGLGFYIGCIFFVASTVIEIAFTINAFSSFNSEEFEGEELDITRKYIIKKAFAIICLSFILMSACIPFLIADSESHLTTTYLPFDEWFFPGMIFIAIATLICSIANIVTDHICVKKGIYTIDRRIYTRRNNFIYPLAPLAKVLLPTVAITVALNILCLNVLSRNFFLNFMGTEWSDKTAFINYMETPLEADGDPYDDTYMHFQTTIVKNKKQEELCRFQKKNHLVASYYVVGQDRNANYAESIIYPEVETEKLPDKENNESEVDPVPDKSDFSANN